MVEVGESAELVEFREKWRAEVRNRSYISNMPRARRDPSPLKRSAEHYDHASPPNTNLLQASHSRSPPERSSGYLSSAVHFYRLAAQKEQEGHLEDALALYRHAFRLDPNADRAHSRAEQETKTVNKYTSLVQPEPSSARRVTEMRRDLEILSIMTNDAAIAGPLTKIVLSFDSNAEFKPEDELKGLHLKLLPDELLVLILGYLEPSSVETFARVCKKARIMTLDSIIWECVPIIHV